MKDVILEKPPWIKGEWLPEELIFEIDDNLSGAEKTVLDSYDSTYLSVLARAGREGKAQYELPAFADIMPRFFKAALAALRGIKTKDEKAVPKEKLQEVIDALDIYAKERFCREVVSVNERDLGNVLGSLSSLK